MTAAVAKSLKGYLPSIVSRRFAGNAKLPQRAEAEVLPAALLFADISGFTPLTEQLAREGPAGVERLSEILNDYFRSLIALIRRHGGDVAKFAGRALLAVWLAADVDGGTLESATVRASRCALAIQQELGKYETGEGLRLSMHSCVSAGTAVGLHVGGYRDRWHYVLTGEPLAQLASALREAGPGDVVLSPEAWELASSACGGSPLGRHSSVKLFSVAGSPDLEARAAEPLSDHNDDEAIFRAYVFDSVLSMGDTPWLVELRRVTALFINLPDLAGQSEAGKAYEYNATSGALIATLSSLNPVGGGSFGSSIAINGGLFVIGAPGETVSGVFAAGRAYTFG